MFRFFRLLKIKEWVDKHDSGAVIIPLSGVLESKVTNDLKLKHSVFKQGL